MTTQKNKCEQKSFPDTHHDLNSMGSKMPVMHKDIVHQCSPSLLRTKFTKRFLGSSEFRGTGRLTQHLAEDPVAIAM